MLPPIPSNLLDFQRMFPNEEACVRYLSDLRWPGGFKCDRCQHNRAYWIASRKAMECASCGHQNHLTAGTVMHSTHTPLLTWFYGAFVVTILTPGISAVQLQKQLGLSRIETAFHLLHKLRSGMVNPAREKLVGEVEVDETYMGGLREGGRGGRSLDDNKTLVVGAVEVRTAEQGHKYAGRVRFRVIADASASSLEPFIRDHIARGTVVYTDGWQGYRGLRRMGYNHVRNIQGDATPGAVSMRLIHLEISNLKTYIRGTYHGRVERQHLQNYLNEFAFRHNRRFYDPGWGFLRVLQLGMAHRSPTYRQMYGADEYGRSVHLGDVAES